VAAPLPDGGHIGFIINRPMNVKLDTLLPQDTGGSERDAGDRMRSNLNTTRNAMLIGVAAITLTGAGAFEPATNAGQMSRLACYVALASDLKPLIDASLPDSIADSPECAAPIHPVPVTGRKADVVPSNDRSGKPAKTSDRTASADKSGNRSAVPAGS